MSVLKEKMLALEKDSSFFMHLTYFAFSEILLAPAKIAVVIVSVAEEAAALPGLAQSHTNPLQA